MSECITWVALDTSKRKHAVAVLDPGVKEPREMMVVNEPRALRRLARKLVREAPGEVRICYEAGPCGYAVQRQLEGSAELVCEVIAPSLVPVRPGSRIKTDRRDARKLVKSYRAGELTVVHPPTAQEEAVRDLVRCREDAMQDLLRARHRLGKFLLRRGHVYIGGKAWTMKHEQWMKGIIWEHEADREVFESYRLAISQLLDRVGELDERIEAMSVEEPYREPVGWLRCFRGIDTITAMTIVAELHEVRRFKSARALMGYLGMVPSEDSSGDRTRRGGLTKAGNSHVRRVLIEATWHNRHRAAVGYRLRKRREGQPAWVIAHADRAMVRLSKRYGRLYARGKPKNKVVAAVAREFVGFIWAVLREGEIRKEKERLQGELRRARIASGAAA
jgi:transposase